MSILVDAAVWRWRGQLWAHLVSDVSHRDLHGFATNIGKKRVSFQGDHYDVNSDERVLAIAAGAQEVSSRELVRSLRRSGLRRQRAFRTGRWSFDVRDSVASIDNLETLLAGFCRDEAGHAAFTAVCDVAATAGLHGGPIDVVALRGSGDIALVLSAHVDLWKHRPDVAHLGSHEAYVSQSEDMVSVEVLTSSKKTQ